MRRIAAVLAACSVKPSRGGRPAGTHVEAEVDADTGTLRDDDLADRGTTLFEESRPTGFTPAEDAPELGSALAVLGQEVETTAHDTPTAQLEIEAGDSATTVELQTPPTPRSTASATIASRSPRPTAPKPTSPSWPATAS